MIIRTDEHTKAAIKTAADHLGQSMSTFVIGAALKKASATIAKAQSRAHAGLSSWFRAACYEAAQGGAKTYADCGYMLARSLGHEVPHDCEWTEWVDEVDELKQHLADGDETPTLAWFLRHYPKFMGLIPQRRRPQFMTGVQRAYERGEVAL